MLSSRLTRAVSSCPCASAITSTNICSDSFPGQPRPPPVQQTFYGDHLALRLRDMQRKRTRKSEAPSLALIWVSCSSVAGRKILTVYLRRLLTGTTNSAVAIMEGQNAKIIENSEGKRCGKLFQLLDVADTCNRCSHDTLSCRLCSGW